MLTRAEQGLHGKDRYCTSAIGLAIGLKSAVQYSVLPRLAVKTQEDCGVFAQKNFAEEQHERAFLCFNQEGGIA